MAKIDCPSCGKAVDEDMLFCPYCFEEFKKQEPAAPPAAAATKKPAAKPAPEPEEEPGEEPEEELDEEPEEEEPAESRGKKKKKVDFFEDSGGDLIDGRYSIVDPFHFTCSRAIYKVEDVTEPGTYYSLREFFVLGEDMEKKDEIVYSFEEAAENFVSLSHPGLARVVDYFTEDNYLFIAYDYVEGKSILDFLNDFHSRIRQGIPEGLVVNWALKICDLLDYLHNRKPEPVYCIDFKPSYLIVSPDGDNITFINIGTPYILDAIGTVDTDGSVYIDSLREEYKSPQRDIWCLGAIIYFLLTGKDIQKGRATHVSPIEKTRPDLSAGFVEIMRQALGENQLSSYYSAKMLKRDLQEKCKSRPIKSYDFYYDYRGIDLQSFNWNTYLGNNQRTNSLGRGPRIPMKPAWTSLTRKGTKAYLTPYEDNVLVSFSDGELFQLEHETGKVKWHFKQSETINSPVIFKDVIYISSSSSQTVQAIKVGKGSPQWEVPAEGMVMSSPCVREDMAYEVTYDGCIIAIEIEEGEIFWSEPLEVRVISSPALDGDILFVSALNGIVYAINLEDRDFLWQFDTEGSLSASPTLLGDYVIVGNHEGFIFCIERQNGDLAWEYDLQGSVTQEIRGANDMIFAVTKKGIFHCFDPKEGELLWKVNLGHTFDYSFAVTNNKVYMLYPDNKIYCFDAFTGKLIDRTKLDEKIISLPLVFNGSLYIVSESGGVINYR